MPTNSFALVIVDFLIVHATYVAVKMTPGTRGETMVKLVGPTAGGVAGDV